ncbi:YggS family pyridoxal phosphate-dependent enzyme [Xanthovirga aplysinae]|uniref:YggS family pyridoxal phosphate-dependent enzyme n=1 Tax=Xanthovirga aplysinae TaxID=2529853 RepID=UPI0012BBFDD3|nr:YggS family pyridoxal phosphate-dependent enzyme [Xanthovirga aplysinae]MTI32712.1 YggS family pyridoxal phosphate-dependent enzyme [Xanthovirga aplysinae]
MSIKEKLRDFQSQLEGTSCKLIAVSKTKPVEMIREAYEAGIRRFGENKVQELTDKHVHLADDIEWHMIGHLQRNKVKYIAPFVSLIHAVDSLRLLKEINKQGQKNQRIINCLLQIHIAQEETKFGLSREELEELLKSEDFKGMKNIKVIGLMGMATNTADQDQVRKEFRNLKNIFEDSKVQGDLPNFCMKELSMGMSGDYQIAIEEGSTMIRVGSAIFGARNYQ